MPSRGVILIALTVQMGVFIALGVGLWIWSGRSASDLLSVTMTEIAWGSALGGALILVAAAAFYGFPRFSERMVRDQARSFEFLKDPLSFGGIVWLSLCAGVGEEALFRAGLQTFLGDFIGSPGAILVSAGLFAVIHLSKPLVGVVIFGGGLLFGWVYWWSGSLVTVAVGHALYDVFALWYVQRELHRLHIFEKTNDVGADRCTENAHA